MFLNKILVDLEEELCPREFGEYLDRKNRSVVDSTICCVDEDEELVTKNDPSRSFIPIEEFPENTDFDYPEVFGMPESEEEFVFQGQVPDSFIEPVIIEDKNCFGKVICAFIDAKTGNITLIREKAPCNQLEITTDDIYEIFYHRIRGTKTLRDDAPISLYREKERTKLHDNLKTMPDRKVQRMNRATLRAIRKNF